MGKKQYILPVDYHKISCETKMTQNKLNSPDAVFKIFDSFEEAERDEKEYYLSLSPEQRLQIIELLREQYYGFPLPRFQRVFEVVEQTQR